MKPQSVRNFGGNGNTTEAALLCFFCCKVARRLSPGRRGGSAAEPVRHCWNQNSREKKEASCRPMRPCIGRGIGLAWIVFDEIVCLNEWENGGVSSPVTCYTSDIFHELFQSQTFGFHLFRGLASETTGEYFVCFNIQLPRWALMRDLGTRRLQLSETLNWNYLFGKSPQSVNRRLKTRCWRKCPTWTTSWRRPSTVTRWVTDASQSNDAPVVSTWKIHAPTVHGRPHSLHWFTFFNKKLASQVTWLDFQVQPGPSGGTWWFTHFENFENVRRLRP